MRRTRICQRSTLTPQPVWRPHAGSSSDARRHTQIRPRGSADRAVVRARPRVSGRGRAQRGIDCRLRYGRAWTSAGRASRPRSLRAPRVVDEAREQQARVLQPRLLHARELDGRHRNGELMRRPRCVRGGAVGLAHLDDVPPAGHVHHVSAKGEWSERSHPGSGRWRVWVKHALAAPRSRRATAQQRHPYGAAAAPVPRGRTHGAQPQHAATVVAAVAAAGATAAAARHAPDLPAPSGDVLVGREGYPQRERRVERALVRRGLNHRRRDHRRHRCRHRRRRCGVAPQRQICTSMVESREPQRGTKLRQMATAALR